MALPSPPPLCQLQNLGLAMTPLFWTGLPQNIGKGYVTLSQAIQNLLTENPVRQSNFIEKLIAGVGRLPSDVTAIIWDFIPPSTVRCLLSLWATKDELENLHTTVKRATFILHKSLVVYHTAVLGGTYICGLSHDGKHYGDKSNRFVLITVPQTIAAIALIYGAYGLREVEFYTEKQLLSASRIDSAVRTGEYLGIIRPPKARPLSLDIEWDVGNTFL